MKKDDWQTNPKTITTEATNSLTSSKKSSLIDTTNGLLGKNRPTPRHASSTHNSKKLNTALDFNFSPSSQTMSIRLMLMVVLLVMFAILAFTKPSNLTTPVTITFIIAELITLILPIPGETHSK